MCEYDCTTFAPASMIQGFCAIATKAIGTIIGRKTVSKGKEYVRLWIYVPTRVSGDSAFPFKIGDPCEIEIDAKRSQIVVRPLPVEKAYKLGWARRDRSRTNAVP